MLAIAGGKGGCGKTTTAVGLARALARRAHSPLVVGADPDVPDLRRLLGLGPEPSTDALPGGVLDRAVHRPTGLPGVAVVPAGRADRLAAARRHARAWPGPVVVDCPPGCDGRAAAPLWVCDRALVVTTDRPQSVEDARKTNDLLRGTAATASGTAVRHTGCSPRTESAPEGLPPVLTAVPQVSSPLADPRARAAYARLADGLYHGAE
ncbi:MAG: septum site-determining protein MinD [Natronomonas sp.]|jgi:septum site-determining protein MinD